MDAAENVKRLAKARVVYDAHRSWEKVIYCSTNERCAILLVGYYFNKLLTSAPSFLSDEMPYNCAVVFELNVTFKWIFAGNRQS